MALTSLEIKDRVFESKFRGYNPEEVDEFIDIITRDYEELVRKNHDQENQIKSLEEKLKYFDDMKESLSQSVILAQETADKVKVAANQEALNVINKAEHDSSLLIDDAKLKANDILRQASDDAKKVAVETEDLKRKTRQFHQQLQVLIEGQLSLVNSHEWDKILQPTATYVQTSDKAFKEVVENALGEGADINIASEKEEADSLDMTRQFTSEELEELKYQVSQAEESGAFEGSEVHSEGDILVVKPTTELESETESNVEDTQNTKTISVNIKK